MNPLHIERAILREVARCTELRAGASWSELMQAILRAGVAVPRDGWMLSRGVLQKLLNEGRIARTEDVKEERYFAVAPDRRERYAVEVQDHQGVTRAVARYRTRKAALARFEHVKTLHRVAWVYDYSRKGPPWIETAISVRHVKEAV